MLAADLRWQWAEWCDARPAAAQIADDGLRLAEAWAAAHE